MPEPWQILAFLNKHPRDKDVRFVEKTHTYYVKGSSKGVVSATGFIHAFFPHFDPMSAIAKMKVSPNWPDSPYYGMTDQQIADQWSVSGKEASGAGTNMHLAIEQFLNGADNRITESVKTTKEWEYFQNFWNDVKNYLEPYRTEWEVWDDEYKLTGSIDIVFKKKSCEEYVIYDWKRSKQIKIDNEWDTGYNPLDHIPNSNYWHYTLQLNIYRWFLEKHYGIKVVKLCIVILHPNNSNYKIFNLNLLDDEVQMMLTCRRRAIDSGSKAVVEFPEPECLLKDD